MWFRRRDEERERLLTVIVESYENQVAVLADLLADSNAKIESLLEAHHLLLEAHRELQNTEKVAAAARVEPTFSTQPLYYSEDEEDALFAAGEPGVDTEIMRDILQEIGFPNTNVEVPA